MKKYIFILSAICLAMSACQNKLEQETSESGRVSDVTFTAENESAPDVKVSLSPDAEISDAYQVHWSDQDKVYITDGSQFAIYNVKPDGDDPTRAVLTTGSELTPSATSSSYYAIYPADDKSMVQSQIYTVNIPAVQKWTSDGIMHLPRIGYSGPERKLVFRNVVSLLKIVPSNFCDSYDGVKIKRIEVMSDVENIAGVVDFEYDGKTDPVVASKERGTKKIVMECEGGASFDETFYVAVLPGTYVGGLTINIISNGGGSQSFVIPEDRTYARSRYSIVRCRISNLAIYEPANCYLVKKSGAYKFPVNVRGNGNAAILERATDYVTKIYTPASIDPASVSSVSTSVISQQDRSVSEHDSALTLKDVLYKDGYVHFTVPEGFTPGNIRIGIHGESAGEYIWSWHIWVNDQVEDVDVGKVHSNLPFGTKLLNMNLGSLQTRNNLKEYAEGNSGLYYQWGRKDPFPPMDGADVGMPEGYTVDAHCDGTAGQNRAKNETAIKYPADFYTGHELNNQVRTWCAQGLILQWTATPTSGNGAAMATYTYEKSMFDPCPPGYRIMDPFTFKQIGYNGSSGVNKWTSYDGYMQSSHGKKPVFPYDGCRTPGTVSSKDGSSYEGVAGNLIDAGSKPYYWIASSWKGDNMNACVVAVSDVTIKKDGVSTTISCANTQKKLRSFAASIRPMRDYER